MSFTLDIIIPVYRGLACTRACIESVLAAPNETAFELIVVDDASPEPELSAYLDDLAARGRVRLLRNTANRGFVHSVNRGMAEHPERDVVLLNSDTEVANDWLDRMVRCAGRDPQIASVTPFSNNATICSFPRYCHDNALPERESVASLDGRFRAANRGRWLEIPTAVGFCMLIRRAALDAVGFFDEVAYGRGYGEENDFCRKAAAIGWTHALCAEVFVFHKGSVSFGDEQAQLVQGALRVLHERFPDYEEVVRTHLIRDPANAFRRQVTIDLELARRSAAFPAQEGSIAEGEFTQLHVVHDLGGGIMRWCHDFWSGDTARRNLLLKPLAYGHDFARGLALFATPGATQPERIWLFREPIAATAAGHDEYRAVLAEIVREYAVGAVIVSSLIGHSVDALRSGLPTLFVHHDFYPLCPDINTHFDGVCTSCEDQRLRRCSVGNPDFDLFLDFPADDRLRVREAFLAAVAEAPVSLVVPTESVARQLGRIAPALLNASFVCIPHGQDVVNAAARVAARPARPTRRLRIVVLGMLSVSKGVRLLDAAIERLAEIADVYLIGSGEVGELFLDRPAVHVRARYEPGQLAGLLEALDPDLGLLLSVWPETYSYTLTELFACGIPPAATRLGSFAERVRHDETGFLFDPTPEALLALLKDLARNPSRLARVRDRIHLVPMRSAAEMVADYHRLLPARMPAAVRSVAPQARVVPHFDADDEITRHSLQLARMWKDHKSLHLQLALKEQRRAAEARLHASRSNATSKRIRALEASLAERERELVSARLQLAEIWASTSWRVSQPVRWLGRRARQLRTVLRSAAGILRRPAAAGHALAALGHGWWAEGLAGLKFEMWYQNTRPPPTAAPIPQASPGEPATAAFADYLRRKEAGLAELSDQLAALPRRPLISVIVPVFDPPAAMLQATLDSVLAQIYPEWELCIADDASTLPHVRRLLHRYAARDARVRVSLTRSNGGVSCASNRALAMARGDFSVLLDHDDLLEEQALLRVAQSVCADAPDLFYSDEALLADDGRVAHLALRPAFSREYLRAHPYIVHLAGFRTDFLRQLGGWDERLRISQDYDLILRASEQARCIVHHPEILYRWRIHGASAGHARMHEVMETSQSILERHLERCGDSGTVSAGPSFNFFETRYAVPAAARVAIVIPTRNHAELVATCIDSIEATCAGVDYRIVLVDHASDDPAALAFFAGLGERVTLLRQDGPFNFARINNRAVAALGAEFTHLLFLNNDVEAMTPGWLEAMLELTRFADVGAVGARLDYPDRETVQHAGVVVAACGIAENLGRFRKAGMPDCDQGYMGSLIATRELSAVTAACLLMRRKVFDEIDGFDESLAVGYGDVDLCLRLRAADYRVIFCPRARLLHHESRTRGRTEGDPHPDDSALFRARWSCYFETGDPYFNPNLSPYSPNWQIAQPLAFRPKVRRRVYRREAGAQRAHLEMPD